MEAANKKLERLRTDLVNGLSEGVIGDLMDRMLDADVINKSECEEIRQVNKTTKNKARCLIDIVSRKGSRAIEKLIQSLNNTDPELCYHLDISSKENKHVPTTPPAQVIEELKTPRPEPPTPPAPVVLGPGDWMTPSPQRQNNELSQMARRPILLSQSANLFGMFPTVRQPQSPMEMPHSYSGGLFDIYRPQCRVLGPAGQSAEGIRPPPVTGSRGARPPARPTTTGEEGVDDDDDKRREEQGPVSSRALQGGFMDRRWNPEFLTLSLMVKQQREALGWPSCIGGKPGACLDRALL